MKKHPVDMSFVLVVFHLTGKWLEISWQPYMRVAILIHNVFIKIMIFFSDLNRTLTGEAAPSKLRNTEKLK